MRLQFIVVQHQFLIRHLAYRLLPIRFVLLQPFTQRTFSFLNQGVQCLQLFFNRAPFFTNSLHLCLKFPFQFFHFPFTLLSQLLYFSLLLTDAKFQFLVLFAQFVDAVFTIGHFLLVGMLVFHLLKFQVTLCLFIAQLPDTIIHRLYFLFLCRPYFFLFHTKLLHQFLLLAANLRIPDIYPCLLTILKSMEICFQFLKQQPVLTQYILISPCQFRFHTPDLFQFLNQQFFARYPFDDFFNLHLLVMQTFLTYLFEQIVYYTYIPNQAITLIGVLLLQFTHKPQQPFTFRLRFSLFFLH